MAVLLRSPLLRVALAEGFAFAASGLDCRLADAAEAAVASELSSLPEDTTMLADIVARFSSSTHHTRSKYASVPGHINTLSRIMARLLLADTCQLCAPLPFMMKYCAVRLCTVSLVYSPTGSFWTQHLIHITSQYPLISLKLDPSGLCQLSTEAVCLQSIRQDASLFLRPVHCAANSSWIPQR
jgi:hypothetical protein